MKHFTLNNTEGFNQKELDVMNAEVDEMIERKGLDPEDEDDNETIEIWITNRWF